MQRLTGMYIDRGEAVDDEAAGIDDTGVHQGRYRRRTLHGIGQPGVQQELRRAGKGGQRHQQPDRFGQRQTEQRGHRRRRIDVREDLRQRPGAKRLVEQHGGQHQRQVTDTVGEECPEGVAVGSVAAGILTEQEIQHHANDVPGEQQHDEVTGGHHHQQGRRHQVEQDKKTRVARFLRHVADRVDMHDITDAGYHHRHQHAQRVEQQAAPVGTHAVQRRRIARQAETEQGGGEQKGQQAGDLADACHALLQCLCREMDQQRGSQWQGRQQQDEAVHQPFPRDGHTRVAAVTRHAPPQRRSAGPYRNDRSSSSVT